MLTFKSTGRLLGCGIDAESIDRFSRWEHDGIDPSPFIFSPRELEHYSSLADRSTGLCVSFCCKEAVYKALEHPYNFCDCELLWEPTRKKYSITFTDEFLSHHHICDPVAFIDILDSGECIVEVFLFTTEEATHGKNNDERSNVSGHGSI